VATSRYEVGMPARWMVDRIMIAAGAGEVDLLDGDKATVGPVGCGRNELTFSRGGGGFIANIDGPVRAIRSFIGANSGTFTQREFVFYEGMWENRTFLRVHPGINTFVMAMDLSENAVGMTYRNELNRSGVPIDGTQDSPVEGSFDWEQFSGANGSITNVPRLVTDIEGVTRSSYYQDIAEPNPNSSMLCSGDDHSYGAAGPLVKMPDLPGGVNTDPILGPANRFESTRHTWFDGPEASAAMAALRSQQVDNPLRFETGVAVDPEPPVEPDPAWLSIRVKPASFSINRKGKRKVALIVRNTGDLAATKVRLCLRKSRAVRFVRCQAVGKVKAGSSVIRRMTIRPRREANPGTRNLRVFATAANAAKSGTGFKVKIRRR